MENNCKKCEGLHAAFGWGLVQVADESGTILHSSKANLVMYRDYYKNANPLEWPTCPDCGVPLDLPADDVRKTGGVPRNYGLPLAFLLGACFWAAVWYFFLR